MQDVWDIIKGQGHVLMYNAFFVNVCIWHHHQLVFFISFVASKHLPLSIKTVLWKPVDNKARLMEI